MSVWRVNKYFFFVFRLFFFIQSHMLQHVKFTLVAYLCLA